MVTHDFTRNSDLALAQDACADWWRENQSLRRNLARVTRERDHYRGECCRLAGLVNKLARRLAAAMGTTTRALGLNPRDLRTAPTDLGRRVA